jgi:hypothetical protein
MSNSSALKDLLIGSQSAGKAPGSEQAGDQRFDPLASLAPRASVQAIDRALVSFWREIRHKLAEARELDPEALAAESSELRAIAGQLLADWLLENSEQADPDEIAALENL